VVPESQYVPAAFERSFGSSGRMALLSPSAAGTWTDGYAYRPFKVTTVCREFTFSKRKVAGNNDCIASNISAVWTPHFREVLIGGTQQGRKQFDASGASITCRKRLWEAAVEVLRSTGSTTFDEGTKQPKYGDIKASEMLAGRRRVKDDVQKYALAGWARNTGDDGFEL
jgi:tRNA-specific adenosine deaminase 1